MFQNGIEKPLLKWLKKEAGKDWVDKRHEINTTVGAVVYFFSPSETECSDAFFVELSYGKFCILQGDEGYKNYTRAQFRKALRKLKGGK